MSTPFSLQEILPKTRLSLSYAVDLSTRMRVYGFHFRKVAEKIKGSGMFDGKAVWDGKDGYV